MVEVIGDADGACVGHQAKINLDLRLRMPALNLCGGGLSDFEKPLNIRCRVTHAAMSNIGICQCQK